MVIVVNKTCVFSLSKGLTYGVTQKTGTYRRNDIIISGFLKCLRICVKTINERQKLIYLIQLTINDSSRKRGIFFNI